MKWLNKITETLSHYSRFFVLKKGQIERRKERRDGHDVSCDVSPRLTFSSVAQSASLSSHSTPLSSASGSGPGGPSQC